MSPQTATPIVPALPRARPRGPSSSSTSSDVSTPDDVFLTPIKQHGGNVPDTPPTTVGQTHKKSSSLANVLRAPSSPTPSPKRRTTVHEMDEVLPPVFGLNTSGSENDDVDDKNLDSEGEIFSDGEFLDAKYHIPATRTTQSPPKSDRPKPSACLFVASLAASRTDEQLLASVSAHFEKWGPPLHVKVLKDPLQRPYAFVQFSSDEEATRALTEAHNTVVDGRHIRVEKARVNRTIWITRQNLRGVGDGEVRGLLEPFGELEEVVAPPTVGRNVRRGCFARFVYREDAISAYTNLRRSNAWLVEWAQNLDQDMIEKVRNVPIDTKGIYIGGLPPSTVTKDAVVARFGQYGKIIDCNVVTSSNKTGGGTKAFAFVQYETDEDAAAAVKKENRATFMDSIIRVQHRELHDRVVRNALAYTPRPAPPPIPGVNGYRMGRAASLPGTLAPTFFQGPQGAAGIPMYGDFFAAMAAYAAAAQATAMSMSMSQQSAGTPPISLPGHGMPGGRPMENTRSFDMDAGPMFHAHGHHMNHGNIFGAPGDASANSPVDVPHFIWPGPGTPGGPGHAVPMGPGMNHGHGGMGPGPGHGHGDGLAQLSNQAVPEPQAGKLPNLKFDTALGRFVVVNEGAHVGRG
ncbi:hypothetical protein YB2330_005762 [Saitoella coloradoensis]